MIMVERFFIGLIKWKFNNQVQCLGFISFGYYVFDSSKENWSNFYLFECYKCIINYSESIAHQAIDIFD